MFYIYFIELNYLLLYNLIEKYKMYLINEHASLDYKKVFLFWFQITLSSLLNN